MGMASASSSSAAANNTNGSLTINAPNYVAWLVGGLVVVVVAMVFLKRRK
jgi:hypothetical protein